MSYFKFEAIINYPKLEAGVRSKDQVSDQKFSAQLLIGEAGKSVLKSIKDYANMTYPSAEKFGLDIAEKEREILGDGYKKRFATKGWVGYCKFLDLYKEPIDPATIQSGDKVLVQVKVIQVINSKKAPGKKFIQFSPNIVTLVEKGSYTLYDPSANFEEKNNDYFEEVKKYKKEGIIEDVSEEESEEW